jgi:hypothetical protein
MGATVSRIRMELIFRGCWNLVTPCGKHSTAGETARALVRWRRSSSTTAPGIARSFPLGKRRLPALTLVSSIGQTALPEKVKLRDATLVSQIRFGDHCDGSGGRSLAVCPSWTPKLGSNHLRTWWPRQSAAAPMPTTKIKNRIDTASTTLPRCSKYRLGSRMPGPLFRDDFVGEENGFFRKRGARPAHGFASLSPHNDSAFERAHLMGRLWRTLAPSPAPEPFHHLHRRAPQPQLIPPGGCGGDE